MVLLAREKRARATQRPGDRCEEDRRAMIEYRPLCHRLIVDSVLWSLTLPRPCPFLTLKSFPPSERTFLALDFGSVAV